MDSSPLPIRRGRGRPTKHALDNTHQEDETPVTRRRRLQAGYSKTYRERLATQAIKSSDAEQALKDEILSRLARPQEVETVPATDPAIGTNSEHTSDLIDTEVRDLIDDISFEDDSYSSRSDTPELDNLSDEATEPGEPSPDYDPIGDGNDLGELEYSHASSLTSVGVSQHIRESSPRTQIRQPFLFYKHRESLVPQSNSPSIASRQNSLLDRRQSIQDSSTSVRGSCRHKSSTSVRGSSSLNSSASIRDPSCHESSSSARGASCHKTPSFGKLEKRHTFQRPPGFANESLDDEPSPAASEPFPSIEADEETYHSPPTSRATSPSAYRNTNSPPSRLESGEIRAALTLIQHLTHPKACPQCTSSNASPRRHVSGRQVTCNLEKTYKSHDRRDELPSVIHVSEIRSNVGAQKPLDPTLRSLFCGNAFEREEPPRMDLSLDRPEECPKPMRSYDIDSILGFIPSLSALKEGLEWFHSPEMVLNIKKNIHLKITIENEIEPSERVQRTKADFRDIPHFLLGMAGNRRDIFVYLVFPHLFDRDKKFESLSHSQHQFIQDEIIRPATDVLPSHIRQHYPASYDVAYLNSTAKQTESRKAYTTSYNAKQNISHHIPPEFLESLWCEIKRRLATSGRPAYRDAMLFVNAKDLKLQIRSPPSDSSLLALLTIFQRWLDGPFDIEKINPQDFYADVAREITPPYSSSGETQEKRDSEKFQTYFFKRCCLKYWREQLHGAESTSQHTLFTNYFLHDAANMICTPSPRELLGQEKVLYTQYYACHKESMNAASLLPFQGNMDDIGIDPQMRTALASAAGVSATEIKIPLNAYNSSKRRVHAAMSASRMTSFGCRAEVRCPLNVLAAMAEILTGTPESDVTLSETSSIPVPDYVWVLPTYKVNDYVSGNTNKFAAALELALDLTKPKGQPNWGQTQMIIALLRLLRFFVHACDIKTDMALAVSKIQRPDRPIVRGLGLEKTLRRYKYAWLPAIFRWSDFSIMRKYKGQMLFGSRHLLTKYIQRYGRVRDTADSFSSLEDCSDWLVAYGSGRNLQEIMLFMVHLVLREFRRAVYTFISLDMKEINRRPAPSAELQLTYDGIKRFTTMEPFLVSGNRQSIRDPLQLLDWLYGTGKPYRRGRWSDYGYRVMIQKALSILQSAPNAKPGDVATFTTMLLQETLKYHWILPMPNEREFHQRDHGPRKWFSIVDVVRSHNITKNGLNFRKIPGRPRFAWGKKQWNQGFPPELPPALTRSTQEWSTFLQKHHDGNRLPSVLTPTPSRSTSSP